MKRFLFKTASLLLAVCTVITGCNGVVLDYDSKEQEDSFYVFSSNCDNGKQDDIPLIETSLNDNPKPGSFYFNMAMNLFDTDKDNSIGGYIGFKKSITDNEEIKLNLSINVSPDSSLDAKTVPIKIFVIADGEIIPFSIIGNTEYLIQNTTEIIPNQESVIPIAFNGSPEMYLISIIVCAFPKDIPGLGIEQYSGVCTYTFVNTSKADKNLKYEISDLENYVKVNPSNENIGIGIDIKPLEELNRASSTQHGDNLLLNKSKGNLWVKFNEDSSGEDELPLKVYYSLFVLCDGEPIPMFDGEYTHIVHTPAEAKDVSSEAAFQYAIPKDLIPDDGLHVFQCIAVPCYIQDADKQITGFGIYGMNGFSSPKIRVVVEGELL